ncbi:hypothetical protein Bb109J_c1942 [Bdellovibrio bacteriovorus]|uniref:hypothetical protein n=1 Tax=Bdellovibrio bacteriovorus TaxID=959 RepID=UPI00045C1814|nr:hypothetical protein [Bdellovibrio bacteriovorus]AHZ84632.1 hypothetical protein EP01_06735 [Bdellovibrio bacteriovorus]BEV68522.1 hypothetical protein Bb109J_c1942 [Bdellovibrio bacteriovorus]
MEWVAVFLKVFLPLYDMYLKKLAKDEQSIKDYIEFNEIMARRGLKSVQDRMKATDQIQKIQDAWAKENGNVGKN